MDEKFTNEISNEMLDGISQETWGIAGSKNRTMEALIASELLEARKRIAELEAVQRWILVSDRLPDSPVHVMMVLGTHARNVTSGFFDGQDWHDLFMRQIYPVTHWMPLPKAP